MYTIIQYVAFCVWFLVLRIMLWDLFLLVHISTVYSFLSWKYSILFVYPFNPADQHLGCFQVLAVVEKLLEAFMSRPLNGCIFFFFFPSVVNTSAWDCCIIWQIFVQLGRKLSNCCRKVVAFYSLSSSHESSSYSTFSPVLGMVSLFNFHPSYWFVVVSHFSSAYLRDQVLKWNNHAWLFQSLQGITLC